MTTNTVEFLKWDSQFFGYPVARIVFDQDGGEKLDILLRQVQLERIRLSYLFVSAEYKELNNIILSRGCKFVDEKTVYSKSTEKQKEYSNKITEYSGVKINDRLIELVLQAGKFSRYNLDINFKNSEYERLYTEWLKKSVNKTIAFKTFVALHDSKIIGITTLGKKSEYADIGLVAVDAKFRGIGIGSDLIHFADNTAFELGYRIIKVVTQLQNKGACRLYEKCNFQIESIVNVYHYWQ